MNGYGVITVPINYIGVFRELCSEYRIYITQFRCTRTHASYRYDVSRKDDMELIRSLWESNNLDVSPCKECADSNDGKYCGDSDCPI